MKHFQLIKRILCCPIAASVLLAYSLSACDKLENAKIDIEEVTNAAWAAFSSGRDEKGLSDAERQIKFETAIANAERCIQEFRGSALLKEDQFKREKADLPEGAVGDEMAKRIFANALLNDVATCYFIKGYALEKLGR